MPDSPYECLSKQFGPAMAIKVSAEISSALEASKEYGEVVSLGVSSITLLSAPHVIVGLRLRVRKTNGKIVYRQIRTKIGFPGSGWGDFRYYVRRFGIEMIKARRENERIESVQSSC